MATPNKNTTKVKKITYSTPKGMGLFTHIVEPDYGTEQYPIKDGQFSTTLILDADATEVLKAKLKNEIDEACNQAEEKFAGLKRIQREKLGSVTFNPVCAPEYDKEDNPTGNYVWRFKTAAYLEDRNTGKKRLRTVPVFDSLNQRVELPEEPGNGSIIRVSFTTNPYFVDGQGMGGLSLYLNAVQILKLSKGGERRAEDYGFTAEEDGFTAETETEAEEQVMHCGPNGCSFTPKGSEDDADDGSEF